MTKQRKLKRPSKYLLPLCKLKDYREIIIVRIIYHKGDSRSIYEIRLVVSILSLLSSSEQSHRVEDILCLLRKASISGVVVVEAAAVEVFNDAFEARLLLVDVRPEG